MFRFAVIVFALFATLAAPAQDRSEVAALMKTGNRALQDGDFTGGIDAFRKVTELDPTNGTGWQLLGYCLHAAQRLDEALPIHLKAAEFDGVAGVALYNAACVHSLKGDKDKAFEYLQQAVAKGFNDADQLAGDTDFDAIRDDARFQELAKQLGSGMQVFSPTTSRHSARLAFFQRRGSPGQIAIDHAVLPWQDDYEQALQAPKFVGKKWRLGADFWTTLDSSIPLRIAGVEVAAGYWYLTLERRGEQEYVLGVHDPVAVRAQRVDPYRADLVQGGIEVPLSHRAADALHRELRIAIAVPPGEQRHGKLTIAFGPHELSADVLVQLPDAAR